MENESINIADLETLEMDCEPLADASDAPAPIEVEESREQFDGTGHPNGPTSRMKHASKRKSVANKDLKKLFAAQASVPPSGTDACAARIPSGDPIAATPHPSPGPIRGSGGVLLSAFKLSVSDFQEVPEVGLAPPLQAKRKQDLDSNDDIDVLSNEAFALETLVLVAPMPLSDIREIVPLVVANVPLLPSGKAIFKQLPPQWLDVTGRSDALGTRCLFASRRHEHSVFEAVRPEQLLQVPAAAQEWQLPMSVPPMALDAAARGDSLVEEEPWTVQVHPVSQVARVLVRPGVLLLRMLRRGTALPAAHFAWRVTDTSGRLPPPAPAASCLLSTSLGEFSILSNVEDAACVQPPNFLQYPLRREQLRSLGWMLSQERRRKETFVTELRDFAPCPDAPHWHLEGSVRCEYRGVKGGVLADAIGYGKTACTIGLVDSTRESSLPRVPYTYAGFIPSRATLVLAPTNLHGQWLAEITKFTGDALKVISVPTCAQLKRLSIRELAEADIVVSTYRLFYSTPYLSRLEQLARDKWPSFSFPKQSTGQAIGIEWSRSYRTAFEALPAWTGKRFGRSLESDPVTPAKKSCTATEEDITPEEACAGAAAGRRRRGKVATPLATSPASVEFSDSQSAKRRRLVSKQSQPSQPCQLAPSEMQESSTTWPEEAASIQYVPLEAFWWRRVVCDEFHELLSRYPPAQVAVELFHAEYKWGLSGTPPCQTLAQIGKAAGFLGVQLPTPESGDREESRKVAQEWLDAFVRRNTAELPPLEEEERIVPVRQTPKERALYLALTEQHNFSQGLGAVQAVDMPQEAKQLQEASRSTSGLLKLCSHFCVSGASDVLTAEDECERQLAIRREQARASEREVRSLAERVTSIVQLVQHFEPYFALKPAASNSAHIVKEAKGNLAARLKFLGASTLGTKGELLERLLTMASSRSSAVKERALDPGFDGNTAGKASLLPTDTEGSRLAASLWKTILEQLDQLKQLRLEGSEASGKLVLEAIHESLTSCGAEPPHRCVRMRSHLGMPKWPGCHEPGSDERKALEAANWTWMWERGNAEKLQKVIDSWKVDIQRCAQRLQALQSELAEKMLSLRSFQDTLHASQMAAQLEDLESERTSEFSKYGSKIETLVKHIKKIQSDDRGCKIICFVQWEDLKRKVSSALAEFGLEHLTLQGSVWARQTSLRRFQYEVDGPKMLLLSLEESASGTNLTAANHVLIVHPMEAESSEEAVAFEMQAVGRVRRPGQLRKIHIWRFVTMGTIEQQITEDHQRELWERQSAKILVTQGHCGDLGDSDLEDVAAPGGSDVESSTKQCVEECIMEDTSTQCYLPLPIVDNVRASIQAMSYPSSSTGTKGIEYHEADLDNTQKFPEGCSGAGYRGKLPSSPEDWASSPPFCKHATADTSTVQ